ncbi:hypothetical protein BT96DRAFT_972924 [Gymnopus androsaceus JB14]|uniref:Uncharacterized protein n=1 Tax=Gymnopus androsaceus JB14 TaxID=1447944 RepID=A0A6A4I4U7_9AGAR|nr:hypothetical protein BT96DRAFT_972924 [Gymnopus androsaceus JB14]
MFKISALALSAILFAGVSANPLRRDTCNPNAQGNPVFILNEATGLEWAAPNMFNIIGEPYAGSLEFPGWKIPQTGEFPTSYFIEDIATPGMTATINAGELDLDTLNNEIFQPNQVFTISCTFCGTDVSPGNILASGCVIGPFNVSNACIRIGPDAGDPLRNFGCSTVRDNEVYTIMT